MLQTTQSRPHLRANKQPVKTTDGVSLLHGFCEKSKVKTDDWMYVSCIWMPWGPGVFSASAAIRGPSPKTRPRHLCRHFRCIFLVNAVRAHEYKHVEALFTRCGTKLTRGRPRGLASREPIFFRIHVLSAAPEFIHQLSTQICMKLSSSLGT